MSILPYIYSLLFRKPLALVGYKMTFVTERCNAVVIGFYAAPLAMNGLIAVSRNHSSIICAAVLAWDMAGVGKQFLAADVLVFRIFQWSLRFGHTRPSSIR